MKKYLKILLALLVLAATCLGITACNNVNNDNSDETDNNEQQEEQNTNSVAGKAYKLQELEFISNTTSIPDEVLKSLVKQSNEELATTQGKAYYVFNDNGKGLEIGGVGSCLFDWEQADNTVNININELAFNEFLTKFTVDGDKIYCDAIGDEDYKLISEKTDKCFVMRYCFICDTEYELDIYSPKIIAGYYYLKEGRVKDLNTDAEYSFESDRSSYFRFEYRNEQGGYATIHGDMLNVWMERFYICSANIGGEAPWTIHDNEVSFCFYYFSVGDGFTLVCDYSDDYYSEHWVFERFV